MDTKMEKRFGYFLLIMSILTILISSAIKIFYNLDYSEIIFIWFGSAIVGAVGFLMLRSGEAEKLVEESNLKVNKEFEETKKKEREKDDFKKFLDQFNQEEIEIIELVHTYEGISETTLAKRVAMPKEQFETSLKYLKDKGVLSGQKKIYLKKLS